MTKREEMFDATARPRDQSFAIFDVSFTKDLPLLRLRSGVCVCVGPAQTRGTRRPECNSNKKQSRIQLQGRTAGQRFAVSSASKVTEREIRLLNSPSDTSIVRSNKFAN